MHLLADERLRDQWGKVCGDKVGDAEHQCVKGVSHRLPLDLVYLDEGAAKISDF